MKTFIVICALAAVAFAEPIKRDAVAAAASSSVDATAETLKSFSDVGPESYKWEYETSNQIKANENGQLKEVGTEKGIAVQGTYSYLTPDGTTITMTYVADENGFQPQGDHLPTPPPIPEAILRGIQYIKDHPSQEQPGATLQ